LKRAFAIVFVLASFLLAAVPLHAVKISVAGRVVDADGKALPNAKVSLIPVPSSVEQGRLELAGKIDPEPAATATADAAGAYLLTAPDIGMWKVKIEAPGFVALETLLLPLLEETDLPEARLSPDVRLEVRLTDPQGRPVAGGRVRVEGTRTPGSNDLWWISPRIAPTDAKGIGVLPRIREEVLTVRASAPGFPLAEQKNVRSGSAALRLAAGRARQILVQASKGKDAKGQGVPGVLVRLGDKDWPVGFTSEAGLLDLAIPETGAELRLAAADGRRVDFHLKPAKPEEKGPAAIDLPAGVPVTGKVVSAQDGRALPGALAYPGGDYGPVVRSAADGTFRLPALPPKGGVHVTAAGFFPAWAEASGNRAPTLALRPRLAASGTVVDEAGKPVAGASLKATLLPGAQALNDQAAYRSGGFARSGPDGRFRLGGFLAGFAYDLRIDKEGFAPARQELPVREPGQPAPELRIVLRAGRVAFGAVIDAGRRPVSGARVTLQPAAPAGFAARLRAAREPEKFEGSTDAAGRFEVKSLPAGTFDLTVRGRGFAPLTVPGLDVPEGSGRTDLGTVMLAPGVALRGLVTDAKGGPVEGAEVRARAAERSELPGLHTSDSDKEAADAVTSPDGSFVLADRAPGESLDLSVLHPSYGPGKAPGVAVPSEAPIRIVLQATSRVSGRATGPDGKPVAGAFVFLSELESVSLGGQSGLLSSGRLHDGRTDDDGSFSLEGVAPGPVRLNAQAPGRQKTTLEGLEVKPGQDLTGLQVVLAPGATIEGRVLSPDGGPVTGAEVVVVEPSPDGGPSFSPLRARTDGDGQYRIDGIAPGPRVLEARAEGYQRAVRDVEVSPEARAVDFRLERGLEVSGRVVDAAGSPIPSAQLSLIAGDDFFQASRALSGPEGAFRFSGLKAGTYRLMARKDGYASDRRGETVMLAGSSVSGLEVKLSAGGTIAGRISGLEPSQLSRVRVWAGSELHLGNIDPEGGYRIANLPPGDWLVTAVVPDTPLHAEGRASLEPGVPEARVDLELGGGHELTGVVLRNGQPLAGAHLALTRGGMAGSQTAASDHQGSFRFGGLEDGTYDLDVSTPNGARHRESVEISENRRIELRTASLSGRVVDASGGEPISGVRISLATGDDGPSSFSDVTTDARGAFRLIEVGDGAWKLRASREGYASAEREVRVDGSAPDEIEIRLSPTEGVTVEALLASGQPPDRIQVAVLGPGGETVATGTYPTGENGRTRVSNVPPGSWRLLIESDQSAAITIAASVPGPAVRAILPPAGALRVKVPALTGDSTVVKVTLTGSGGPFQGFDWDGRVRSEWDLYRGEADFSRVPAGSWQVTARAPDGRTWTGTATVTPGGSAEVTLE
jgi:hypothetical protein